MRPIVAGGSDETRAYWSLILAVAQWRRNAYVTGAAISRLRGLQVSEAEILARRRAGSNDPALAAFLRLAVTSVIARGQLLGADLRFAERHELCALLPRIAAYAADALAFIEVAQPDRAFVPDLDMDVGDY